MEVYKPLLCFKHRPWRGTSSYDLITSSLYAQIDMQPARLETRMSWMLMDKVQIERELPNQPLEMAIDNRTVLGGDARGVIRPARVRPSPLT
ncbi:3628_t:CDS:2, partial [Acaulospora colombiana]